MLVCSFSNGYQLWSIVHESECAVVCDDAYSNSFSQGIVKILSWHKGILMNPILPHCMWSRSKCPRFHSLGSAANRICLLTIWFKGVFITWAVPSLVCIFIVDSTVGTEYTDISAAIKHQGCRIISLSNCTIRWETDWHVRSCGV